MLNNITEERMKRLRLALYEKNVEKIYATPPKNQAVMEFYQNEAYKQYKDNPFDINKEKEKFQNYILCYALKDRISAIGANHDNYYIWGMMPKDVTIEKITTAIKKNKRIIFAEDGFLRSILTYAKQLPADEICYQGAASYIIDDLTFYFDATRQSRMEIILNSDYEISKEEIIRVKSLINKILKLKISKYNSQPIYTPKVGADGRKKILVVDQSYNDYSILKGMADKSTFENMLKTAIDENPGSDIIIKTHPDSIGVNSLKPLNYYKNINEEKNIYKITEEINPICLMESVDKVYAVTSQLGFEALMAKKEVHTFGMPFYAGWGLTIDRLNCSRRKRKRTLEEIFYIAYILMSIYINPKTNKPCEIEDAIDYLAEYRELYFKKHNIVCKI